MRATEDEYLGVRGDEMFRYTQHDKGVVPASLLPAGGEMLRYAQHDKGGGGASPFDDELSYRGTRCFAALGMTREGMVPSSHTLARGEIPPVVTMLCRGREIVNYLSLCCLPGG